MSDRDRILALFADPKDLYTRSEVIRLTRTPAAELDAILRSTQIAPDALEPDRFAWHDLAFLAVHERWGVRRIASTLLRHGRADVVPPYNRLVRVSVQLPANQLHALRVSAAQQSQDARTHWTVSDVLVQALSWWIDSNDAIEPAIQEADRWPAVDFDDYLNLISSASGDE